MGLFSGNDALHDKRMELTEHLGELRTRIMRSIMYIIVGAIVAYQFFPLLYGALYRPLSQEMRRQNSARTDVVNVTRLESVEAKGAVPTKDEYDRLVRDLRSMRDNPPARPVMSIVFRNFHEPFMVRVSVSMIFGLVLVTPLVLWELALFITPALTPTERRPLRLLIPISIFLMAAGVAVAYTTMFYAMRWFLSYLDDFPQPAVLMQDPNDYILFFVKMMAIFGLAFQLPVVLMGGAFAGLITSNGLIKHWRWGFVIAALGGVFTPSNDLPSIALMSGPLLLLYFGSIVLVRFVERMKAKNSSATERPR